MNDDIERRLRQVTTRGAPPELRPRVLAAVAEQLQPATPLPSRRSFRPHLLSPPLCLQPGAQLLGERQLDRRLAIVLGPPPVPNRPPRSRPTLLPSPIPPPANGCMSGSTAARPETTMDRQYAVRLQQLIQQFTIDFKETADETPRKNPQMDRDRRGSRDCRPADAQCLLRVEHRYTA